MKRSSLRKAPQGISVLAQRFVSPTLITVLLELTEEQRQVLLNGTQALVRLMLMQRARDAAAGLNYAHQKTDLSGRPLAGPDVVDPVVRQERRLGGRRQRDDRVAKGFGSLSSYPRGSKQARRGLQRRDEDGDIGI